MDKLIKVQEVCAQVGFGKTKVWALVKSGVLPKPYYPNGPSARWSQNEIQAWIEARKQGSERAA